MKRLLQTGLGLIIITGLAATVMWLVRAAPGRQLIPQPTATSNELPPIVGQVATPTLTLASAVEEPATVTPENLQQSVPESTPTPQLDFDKLAVTGVEEIPAGPYFGMLWSPDGTKALTAKNHAATHFLTGGGQSGTITGLGDLWLLDLAADTENQLANQISSAVWSPDGDQVAYLAPTGEGGIAGALYVLDIASNQTRQIAQVDFLGGDYSPQWLPTDEITFVRDGQLWVVRPDGSGERALNGWRLLSRVGAEGGKPVYMADRSVPVGYHFSPMGERVAYLTLPSNERDISHLLWLANADASNAQMITDMATSSYYNWSPDGEWLVFDTYGLPDDPKSDYEPEAINELWAVRSNGSDLKRLHRGDNWEWLLTPAWAPDSQMIVYIVEHAPKEGQPNVRDLWLAEIITGRTRKLREAIGDVVDLSWAPDGKYIYILRDISGTSSAFQSSRLRLTTQ